MKLNVQDLIDQGLVVKKTYTEGKYKGLSVLKYHRKVFYDNLWHLDDRLLECRGTVVDEDWNVRVLPFKKVFNLNENGTTVDTSKTDLVCITEKVNGFMAAMTYDYKIGDVIISTTGSLDSDHVKIAEKHLDKYKSSILTAGYTYLFEICDSSDPHIVQEDEGAYLIGIRDLYNGKLIEETIVDSEAEIYLKCKRPSSDIVKFSEIPQTKKEGFMVRNFLGSGDHLCKIKSPYYLSKKAIMRLGKAKVDLMFDNKNLFKQRIDEEFYGLLDYIVETFDKEVWRSYNDQQRRVVIEEFFNG